MKRENKKNVSPGDTIEIKKVCKISQGWYNIGDTFTVKDVLQKGVMVEVESDLPYIYIKNKEFRVYPKISDKRLNEFACPLESYFDDVIKTLDNALKLVKITQKDVDLNEPIFGDMLVDENGKLILSHEFDTVGIITDSERFFYEKIKGYRNDKLRMFVMIKDEKSIQGHKFAFIVMDSNFEERHELLEICEFNRM